MLRGFSSRSTKALQTLPTDLQLQKMRSSQALMDNLTHVDDPLIKVLLQEKQIFWTTNSHRSDEERHLLWAERAAQLNSIIEAEAPRKQIGSRTSPPRRSDASIPRSVSYGASSAQAPPSV